LTQIGLPVVIPCWKYKPKENLLEASVGHCYYLARFCLISGSTPTAFVEKVRPMRVKLFWKNEPMKPGGFLGFNPTGKNAQDFDAEINAWLQNNQKIKIVEIKQSASGGSLAGSLWLISVWYEEGP
jgi:hypothetical protein